MSGRSRPRPYREVMSDTDREHLVANIVGHASDDVASETQLRVVA